MARRAFSGSLAITYLSSAMPGPMVHATANKKTVSLAIVMLVLVLWTDLLVIHNLVQLGLQ